MPRLRFSLVVFISWWTPQLLLFRDDLNNPNWLVFQIAGSILASIVVGMWLVPWMKRRSKIK